MRLKQPLCDGPAQAGEAGSRPPPACRIRQMMEYAPSMMMSAPVV